LDLELKEDFLAAVDELVEIGLVSVKWRRFREGTDLDALYLEDPEKLYEALGRPSPETIRQRMVEVLRSDAWTDAGTRSDIANSVAQSERVERDELRHAVRTHLLGELEVGHPVAVESVESLVDLGAVFSLDRSTARSLPIRALSVRLFNDSKRLEQLLKQADAAGRKAAGVAISHVLGLARSYPEVLLAIRGSLQWRDPPAADGTAPPAASPGGADMPAPATAAGPGSPDASPGRADMPAPADAGPSGAAGNLGPAADERAGRCWDCRGEPISLFHEAVGNLEAISLASPRPQVLSVENKETFFAMTRRLMDGRTRTAESLQSPGHAVHETHSGPSVPDGTAKRWQLPFAAVIYSGGHPHPDVLTVLDTLAASGATLYHFGDLDPDGLLILSELAVGSGRTVHPYGMTVDVHRRYRSFGYRLSDGSLQRLKAARTRLPEALRPLAAEIEATGLGVEQEVVDFEDLR
jgi:hypothetical protein